LDRETGFDLAALLERAIARHTDLRLSARIACHHDSLPKNTVR
jgi:hypothetical protein